MFEAGLDAPSKRERLNKQLDNFSEVGFPYARIAVNRAKEVLDITGIVDDVIGGKLTVGKGFTMLKEFEGAGFPVGHMAQIAEQLLRYPGLRHVPPVREGQ